MTETRACADVSRRSRHRHCLTVSYTAPRRAGPFAIRSSIRTVILVSKSEVVRMYGCSDSVRTPVRIEVSFRFAIDCSIPLAKRIILFLCFC